MVLIGTDRLRVRPIEAADEPHVRCYAGREDYCPYLPVDPKQPETVVSYVRQQISPGGLDAGNALALAIVPGGVDRPVGTITVSVEPFPVPIGQLEFTLDPEYRGRGYMTEALESVLPLAFRDLGLLRICAASDVDNVDCQNVLERVGMQQTKRLPEYRTVNGEKRDAFLYVLDAKPAEK